MKIYVYTLCWNVEKILPYFLRHYLAFADRIVIYDNYSDDRTESIASHFHQVELRKFDTNGKFDDAENIRIKNAAYKECRGQADYVIVVDIDEFVYHPNIIGLLNEYKRDRITLPKVAGYNMVSFRFPNTQGQIYSRLKYGEPSQGYSKRCIFAPEIDINYVVGAHACEPCGQIRESRQADVKLLHYHYIGLLTNWRRHKECRSRLSEFNRKHNLGWQFQWNPITVLGKFMAIQVDTCNVFNGERSLMSFLVGSVLRPLKQRYEYKRPSRGNELNQKQGE